MTNEGFCAQSSAIFLHDHKFDTESHRVDKARLKPAPLGILSVEQPHSVGISAHHKLLSGFTTPCVELETRDGCAGHTVHGHLNGGVWTSRSRSKKCG